MTAETHSDASSRIAAAIGEPARARMLYSLADGRARTSTELAVIAEVTPSTASVHLQRLTEVRLLKALPQGKHRYYSLNGANVASALEALSVLAGRSNDKYEPSTPNRLRAARTCYDHIAGTLGVALYDRLASLGWLSADPSDNALHLTSAGNSGFASLGIDLEATRTLRRRFAYACLDWSERRFHLAGSLGTAVLRLAMNRKWVVQDLDSRVLRVTNSGRREMGNRLGLNFDESTRQSN